MATTDSSEGRDTTPGGLNPKARTAIASLVIAAAVVGLFLTVKAANTGEEATSLALPDSVDSLIPASGDEVLAQSAVGVDLASGFDAYLIVNGTEIRDEGDGLAKDLGLGRVMFQPGQGKAIESLSPERNCVIAMVWAQKDGPDAAEPVSWCFTAA
ncbi:MAG: hypothetical protein GY812_00855 [Actinomycetia bacterium]|nr:hypothetical protein [Actinomycetes bacterium]